MWGAFGNVPIDEVPEPPKVHEDRPHPWRQGAFRTESGPTQFIRRFMRARVSNDDFVDVSDRGGKRVQVFTIDGKYVDANVHRPILRGAGHCGNGKRPPPRPSATDPEQGYLYVASRSPRA